MIKLSIITINYNNAAGLKKTLDSVAEQTYTDFEHIIVDGASTDGSVDEIIAYSQSPIANRHKITWISEPDTGIYNAMNKGVRMAEGEYTLMLNSGDYLVDNRVIENIIPLLDGTDIIQGNVISIINDVEVVNRGYGKSNISFLDAMGGKFLHQASCCRQELFEKYGMFDESYKINGDTVFYAKCLAFGNASFRYVDVNVAYYDIEGVSADPNNKWVKIRREEDMRYEQMFSQRMRQLRNEQKKISLYDKLHAHRWSWYLTMAIAHVCNWLYGRK
jgi:glycosyltransferase involved in cell wall biosynthesis